MSDPIRREDAIRVASGYCHPVNIAKELEKLPSAEPERKTGRWLETEGLDEEIRCLMCANHMRSDRGCDGHCQYNEHVYKEIMSALERRMTEVEHEAD